MCILDTKSIKFEQRLSNLGKISNICVNYESVTITVDVTWTTES